MKKLLVVESPAKIKTISKFLGPDFRIMSTVGHVKDLPKQGLGVTINGTIELEYVTLEKKDKVLADICKEAAKASDVYLAPDPDREGEIIAWHVEQEVKKVIKDPSHIHRITFNEITKPAIEEALEHPSVVDTNKVAAQQARRILDRWVGYEVSPVLWKKVSKGLSAGRVQSVALKLICEREDAIRIFKAEEYWSVDGLFGFDGGAFNAALATINKKKAELGNKEAVEKVIEEIKKTSFAISSIKDSKRAKNPYAPFMTSSLQQAAYNQLGFSVQKTMNVAQKLYEGVDLEESNSPVALITYMRTDSLRLSDTALKSARSYINKTFGDEYVPAKSPVYSKEKAQDAHEAIRPIDVKVTPSSIKQFVEPDHFKLYELIWRRFVACQMKPAQYAQRQITIDGKPFTFKVTGSTLLFDGFLKVYVQEEDEKEEALALPAGLKEEMPLELRTLSPKQHFTQPPSRYTEATLVKELEKAGIGRPSTYATILKTIQARSYTNLDTKKRFVPTELGMAVTRLLDENLPRIMNVSFTALMEEDLDKVARGEMERDSLLKAFYQDFSESLKKFAGESTERPSEPTTILCPQCKKQNLVVRFGKTGAFLGCAGFPECTFSSNFKREEDGSIILVEKQEPELLEEKCPKCGKPMQRRIGRYGPFIACSGYPECTYIKQEKSEFLCPGCQKGHLVKRLWKGKVFWACDTYPACSFSVSGDIELTECPKCHRPYLLKRTGTDDEVTLICSDKNCGYSQKK
ncbi:TPA: type I DNA topoisomerase [Candidatus Dependentiae bacterium]|nr:MAG: topoisomerase protein [candidate division TM6 bacterium GW2011_GWF2_43_87]HBL98586.1 type I DNA topoisomerase [Candidatus Dependentiae bacterium]